MGAMHDLEELSVEERRRRIATILAAGLVRLSRSGGLSQKADQDARILRHSQPTPLTHGLSLLLNPG